MKHILATALVATSVMGGSAQSMENINISVDITRLEACQIMMADGSIHSFTPAEISFIEFSNVDAEGYVHTEIVCQDIHLKSGETLKLPITEIESVEFHQPDQTVYAPGVVVLDETALWSHIIRTDENTFTADASTPASALPHPGDLLVTVTCDDHFPYGFSGRVTDVTPQTDGTTLISCAFVDFAETLLEYTATTRSVPGMAHSPSSAPSRASTETHNKYQRYFDFDLPLSVFNATDLGFTVSPSKYPVEGGAAVSFESDYHLRQDIETYVTRTYTYGDVLTETRKKIANSLVYSDKGTFSLSGKVKLIEAMFKKSVDVACPIGIPGLELYFNLDFNLEASMDFTGETNLSCYWDISSRDLHSTNPNIKSFTHSETSSPTFEDTSNCQASMDIKFGPVFELGVRNVGFQQAFGQIGYKAYIEGGGGIELNGTDITPYRNAGYSPSFYNDKAADCNMWVGGYVKFSGNLYAGVKFEFGPNNKEVEWSLAKEFFPLEKTWKWIERNKYPIVSDSKLQLRKTANGKDFFHYNVDGTMTLPVKLGYRIVEETTNEILGDKWFDTLYSSPENLTEVYFEIDNISDTFGHKAIIYPLVQPAVGVTAYDNEVVCEPACPVELDVQAHTGGYHNVTMQGATVKGSIEGYYFLPAGSRYGIMYSTSAAMTGATKVPCSVSEDGSMITDLDNLKPGTKYYYATYYTVDGITTNDTPDSFTTLSDPFIDLGLSVEWNSHNLGGDSEESLGNLYAWGETTIKSDYTWDTYFDSPYDEGGHMKGCTSVTVDIAGNRDYDAPVYDSRDDGRLPTRAEIQELIDKCTWEWTTRNGVNGYVVTSTINGNSIFLPAAGMQDGSNRANIDTYGGYWTGTIGSSATKMTGVNLYFTSGTKGIQSGNRYVGRSIRSVRAK